MKTTFRTGLTALLIVSLASCAAGPSSHDPAVAAARNNVLATRKTYLSGALIGAAMGAGAGAIIGNQSNGRNGALAGALAGAAVGLAGGLLYANHVVHQRQAFKDAGDYLNGCARIAREQQASVKKYNDTLSFRSRSIAKDEALLRGSIADSRDVQKRLNREIELQEAALAQSKAEGVSLSRQRAQSAQITALKHEERRLEASLDRMISQQESSRLTDR